MKRWAVAFVLLILAVILSTPDAHSLSVAVDPSGSVQQVLEDPANYDTLFLVTNTYDEDLTIRRQVTILPAEAFQVSVPSVRSLTFDMRAAESSFPTEVRGVRVLRATKVTTGPRENHITISACRLDGGLRAGDEFPGQGLLRVTYCTIFGDVDIAIDRTDFAMNTVLGGGVKLYGGSLGMSRVAGSHVQDAPAIAIEVRDDPRDAIVEYSTVAGAAHGLWLWRGGRATDNLVADVKGDGVLEAIDFHVSVTVDRNRFERCGRGIAIIGGNAGGSVDRNVVLNSLGDGIVTNGPATRNTVVGSGGNGIVLAQSGYTASETVGNLVALNAGFGIGGAGTQGPCNLLWSNGIDARAPGTIYADPLFCDLNAGDVHVAASSPAVGGSCGLIGALGAGCPARGRVAAAPDGNPDIGIVPFGVQQRGRVALVTLAGTEPASLELLDVSGRRISRENLVRSGEIALEQPAGVYFMRLTQGARSSSAKAVVLR